MPIFCDRKSPKVRVLALRLSDQRGQSYESKEEKAFKRKTAGRVMFRKTGGAFVSRGREQECAEPGEWVALANDGSLHIYTEQAFHRQFGPAVR